MDVLGQYLEKFGIDAASLDDAVAVYIAEMVNEDPPEEDIWNMMCQFIPELEEAPSARADLGRVIAELARINGSSNIETIEHPSHTTSNRHGIGDSAGTYPIDRDTGVPSAGDEDTTFLKEMFPSLSEAALQHLLHHRYKGDREQAATYLADRCLSNSKQWLDTLERDAEKQEREKQRRQLERLDLGQESTEEKESLKQMIVGRYADEVHVLGADTGRRSSARAAGKSRKSSRDSDKIQTTRYRDGRVVTTTGAKVIIESTKPEWDGGSRGKVKTKGKRGKGFI